MAVSSSYFTILAGGATLFVHLAAGLGAVVLAAAAWWAWSTEQRLRRSPRSEYIVVAYLATFYLTAALATEPEESLATWIPFLAPVSFLPLALRLGLRDDGAAFHTARRAAIFWHRLFGFGFVVFAVFLGATVWLILAVPIVLVPAALHLAAVRFYRSSPGEAAA
jgi:hypothetical protein